MLTHPFVTLFTKPNIGRLRLSYKLERLGGAVVCKAIRAIRAAVLRVVITFGVGGGLLAGCAMDREDAVRAQVGVWVKLGDTRYFKSSMSCTAGLFAVEGTRISSLIATARSVTSGMALLKHDKAVAFDVKGLSPNTVSERIMTKDLAQGIGVLSSGISGKDCMSDAVKAAYLRALLDPSSVLLFDPQGNAMAVLDRTHSHLYFARGNV